MRPWVPILVLVAVLRSMSAHADDRTDARAEMAAALEAQADRQPLPVAVPITGPAAISPKTAVAPAKPVTSRASPNVNARVVDQIQRRLFGLATALAHQTQAAVQAATGQARGQAARDRAARNSGH